MGTEFQFVGCQRPEDGLYNDTNVHDTPQLCNLYIKSKKCTDNIDCICAVGQAGCQAVGGKTEKEPQGQIPIHW